MVRRRARESYGVKAAAPFDEHASRALSCRAERAPGSHRGDQHHSKPRRPICSPRFLPRRRALGIVGTIGAFVARREIYRGLTTPQSLDFERALSRDGPGQGPSSAAEVSSIGIEEGRVDELSFRACVFADLRPRPSRLSRHDRELLRRQAAGCFTEIVRAAGVARQSRSSAATIGSRPAHAGCGARRQAELRAQSRARCSSVSVWRQRNGRHSRESKHAGKELRDRIAAARRDQPAQHPGCGGCVGGPGYRKGGGGGGCAAMPRGPRQTRASCRSATG